MGLVSLIQNYRKRKSIGSFLARLGPALIRLYGKADYYKPEQVKRAAEEAKLPIQDLCYGLATYCSPEDFDAYHSGSTENCSYWDKRVEIAEHHFHGNVNFTPQDVVAHSEVHSHAHFQSHSHAGGDFGGGHHFGGDGGGHGGGH